MTTGGSPPGGFTADDLDRIPELPRHTELIDGSLVFGSLRANFHVLSIDALVHGMRRTIPSHLRVRREMTVTLAKRQRPEPDVLVVRADAVEGPDQTTFHPADVVLVVEVMSPDPGSTMTCSRSPCRSTSTSTST
jgi:Uma2 family endonuclease